MTFSYVKLMFCVEFDSKLNRSVFFLISIKVLLGGESANPLGCVSMTDSDFQQPRYLLRKFRYSTRPSGKDVTDFLEKLKHNKEDEALEIFKKIKTHPVSNDTC